MMSHLQHMENNVNGTTSAIITSAEFVTDVVVVGTGPAGGALASFLGSYGIKGIMIGITSTTAETPRAHITNMAAAECLRDIDLEDDCRTVASPSSTMMHTRWSYSMAGEEYGRIYSWGNGPGSESKYKDASPCAPMDLPQTLLEPILVRKATLSGFICRFNTEFLSFKEDSENAVVDVRVKDLVFQRVYTIRCKYLFGADGARSRIIDQLGLPLIKRPGGGLAWNVLVRADLSHLMSHRKGNLHWIYQHDIDHPDFAWIGFPRMVKPWFEWVFIILPVPGYKADFPPTQEQWMKRVKQMIGEDSVDVEIVNVSKWQINDVVAEQYSRGRVFCLGDAVHRHPPANGLGSNTSIQDAFNLAWKVAYVLQGRAGAELLDSYNAERQPVGQGIVDRANQGVRDHFPVWQSSGILAPNAATRKAQFAELSADSPAGRERRKAFSSAIRGTRFEFQGVGIEMNQRYKSSAVYHTDEDVNIPSLEGDAILDYHKTTYPGARVPHVWLNTAVPKTRTSTIDLCGKGRFTILTGIGGQPWRRAAVEATEVLCVPIEVFTIGFRQDYEDVYFEWEQLRGVEESGCVLVRPDRFVAWRCEERLDDCTEKLVYVMRKILSVQY